MQYTGVDFEVKKFESIDFTDINLKFTSFTKCNFSGCNFTQAIFDSTSFSECNFSGCCFSGVDFSPIKISKCKFNDTLLNFSTFQKFKGGSKFELNTLDLRDNIFIKCDFSEATFNQCNLRKIVFTHATLVKVVFKKCDLSLSNLSNARIDGTIFIDSIVSKTILGIDGFILFGNSQGFMLNS